ncbi:hypothetical protein NDU88_002179 [Pleurodeles waltl]|uniref:Uncharacterized protein n=1 Tax=Pleurodeles waltl TaxID=8319 RepID=A0AAV7P611_PLEWA|nr:hypothetical protein NDU88_002179 [Pleurodeles waltl]
MGNRRKLQKCRERVTKAGWALWRLLQEEIDRRSPRRQSGGWQMRRKRQAEWGAPESEVVRAAVAGSCSGLQRLDPVAGRSGWILYWAAAAESCCGRPPESDL